MVGHVTKEGQIAGPRVVEHMVDTVLYFEGERGHQFRILRAVKKPLRAGRRDRRVRDDRGRARRRLRNPSALFLSDREARARRRSVVFARGGGHAAGAGRSSRPLVAPSADRGSGAPHRGGLGRLAGWR